MIGLLTITVSIIQLHIANMQRHQDLQIANENRQKDINLAYQTRLQEMLIGDNERWGLILATYIKEISDLFVSINFSLTDTNIAHIIRVKTIITLRQLDPIRKSHLIQFLYESRAIINHKNPIDLTNADLNNVDFSVSSDNPLKKQINLNFISLYGAMLINTSFSNRQLRGANFSFCLLTNSTFENAHIFGTTFESASLQNVNFNNTYTVFVDFGGADLRGATITDEQMHDARSIFEAVLSNGTYGRSANLLVNGNAEVNCLLPKSNQNIVGWTQITHIGNASVTSMNVNSSLSQIAAEEWIETIDDITYYNGYRQNWNLGKCSFVAYGYGHVSLFQNISIPTKTEIAKDKFAWIISMLCRSFIEPRMDTKLTIYLREYDKFGDSLSNLTICKENKWLRLLKFVFYLDYSSYYNFQITHQDFHQHTTNVKIEIEFINWYQSNETEKFIFCDNIYVSLEMFGTTITD